MKAIASHGEVVDDRSPSARANAIKRRNRIVLVLLLVFVGFTFTMGFRHVIREVGTTSAKR